MSRPITLRLTLSEYELILDALSLLETTNREVYERAENYKPEHEEIFKRAERINDLHGLVVGAGRKEATK